MNDNMASLMAKILRDIGDGPDAAGAKRRIENGTACFVGPTLRGPWDYHEWGGGLLPSDARYQWDRHGRRQILMQRPPIQS